MLTVIAAAIALGIGPAQSSVIRGRIVDRETGQPIAKAIVKLAFLGPGTQKRDAVTGDDGHYSFAGLPPGSYNLHAEPPPQSGGVYLSRRYGQSEKVDPVRDSGWTSGITLAAGEEITAVIELSKALTIEGRVTDGHGEPLSRVWVRLEHLDSTPAGAPFVLTDQNGVFTLASVRPGDYHVCADPGTNFASIRTVGRFEGAHPIATCYSNKSMADATALSLSNVGLSGIEIKMQYSLLYSVSGSVIDSTGALLSTNTLMLTKPDLVSHPSSMDVQIANGRFVVRGVPPGEYVITARTSHGAQQRSPDREAGTVSFRVTNADVENLVVQTAKPVNVVGRVELEDGDSAKRPIVNVNFARQQGALMDGFMPPARVGRDLTFRLDNVLGTRVLQVFGSMRPWAVKAIRYRGEDVYGKPIQLTNNTNPDDLVVVLTSRSAAVSGHVSAPAMEARRTPWCSSYRSIPGAAVITSS